MFSILLVTMYMSPSVVFEVSKMSNLVELLLSVLSEHIFTLLYFQIISLQMCLCNNISCINLSIVLTVICSQHSSFFVVVHIFLVYCITSKTVVLKRLAHSDLSNYALSKSLSWHLTPWSYSPKISPFMFWHIFTILNRHSLSPFITSCHYIALWCIFEMHEFSFPDGQTLLRSVSMASH